MESFIFTNEKTEAVFSAAMDLEMARQQEAQSEKALVAAVQDLLRDRGMAREWAERCGFSQQYISDLRYGRRRVSDAILRAILKTR